MNVFCVFCVSGHAFRGAGHQHRGDDGQVDAADGLPRRHHQQEPVGAAAHPLHHRQPGALPVRTGSEGQQQVGGEE